MTRDQSDFLKRNWLNFANIVTIVTAVWFMGGWKANVDARLKILEKHALNKDLHMSFEAKVNKFMTRKEVDVQIEDLHDDVIELKSDIKIIEKLIRNIR